MHRVAVVAHPRHADLRAVGGDGEGAGGHARELRANTLPGMRADRAGVAAAGVAAAPVAAAERSARVAQGLAGGASEGVAVALLGLVGAAHARVPRGRRTSARAASEAGHAALAGVDAAVAAEGAGAGLRGRGSAGEAGEGGASVDGSDVHGRHVDAAVGRDVHGHHVGAVERNIHDRGDVGARVLRHILAHLRGVPRGGGVPGDGDDLRGAGGDHGGECKEERGAARRGHAAKRAQMGPTRWLGSTEME